MLIKVHSPLNYEVLKVLIDKISTNAASVQSDLGGGANGHLGLVKTALDYTHVSSIP